MKVRKKRKFGGGKTRGENISRLSNQRGVGNKTGIEEAEQYEKVKINKTTVAQLAKFSIKRTLPDKFSDNFVIKILQNPKIGDLRFQFFRTS